MNNEKKHIDYLELITKYLAQETTEDEIRSLEDWVKQDEKHKKMFLEHKQAWTLSNSEKTDGKIDLDREWDHLQSVVFGNDDFIEFTSPETLNFNYNRFLKVAAIIVFLLTAGYFLFYLINTPSSEQLVARNSIVSTTLPDGTKVTLNHNSILKYPKIFASHIRAVQLQGDAYFEVSHDLSKPFVIETKNAQIQVMGTSFYVNAKVEQPTVDVIVHTGKVALIGQKSEKLLLTAGERGIYYKDDKRLEKADNQDRNFISWKTGVLIFEYESLVNVIDKINQTYHSNITIDNPDIYHCMLTATFDGQPLEVVLEVIEETFDLTIENKDGKILITGNGCD
jgi:ferric-dicitrate binding protein FerR (iron transport regulator)